MFAQFPARAERVGVAGIHRELRGQRASPPLVGRIAWAVAIMHERYAATLRIAELAAAARLSRSQFDRQFRRLMGNSPMTYRRRHMLS